MTIFISEVMNKARISSDDSINKCKRAVQKNILNAKATAASRVTDAQARLQEAETSSTKRAIKW